VASGYGHVASQASGTNSWYPGMNHSRPSPATPPLLPRPQGEPHLNWVSFPPFPKGRGCGHDQPSIHPFLNLAQCTWSPSYKNIILFSVLGSGGSGEREDGSVQRMEKRLSSRDD
jgi:hypothetical protein